MPKWLLRAEGVNFDDTVLDTKDLSTIRGGSLALLKLPFAVEQKLPAGWELVYKGASQCAYTFPAPDGATATRVAAAVSAHIERGQTIIGKLPAPFPFLTVMVDVVECTDANEQQSLDRADARNRTGQFRRWTIDPLPFEPTATSDAFEKNRPAGTQIDVPSGKITRVGQDDLRKEFVSHSVARRREFGREARQQFYRDELKGASLPAILEGEGDRFAQEFSEIVGSPPAVAASLSSKIAVVYADGNGFGKIRDRIGTKRFSGELSALRKTLLSGLVDWFAERHAACESGQTSPYLFRGKLRFETLLWGGDEMIFVLPSWLAVDFVGKMLDVTRTWKIGDSPLTHAVGVAIAHHKTPVRQLQRVAREAADAAKAADLNTIDTVSFDIFESLSPPDEGLGAFRRTVYGNHDDTETARRIAILGDRFPDFIASMHALKSGTKTSVSFPRSQIYGAIRAARLAEGGSFGTEADGAVAAYFDDYARRAGGGASLNTLAACRLPTASAPKAVDALELALIAQFWDYVDPIGEA